MRVQLQLHVPGADYTIFFEPRDNPSPTGVTKLQMRQALLGIYAQASVSVSRYFPRRLLPQLHGAIVDSSIKYTTAGPFSGLIRNVVQSLFRDPQNQTGQYRLDTDNLAGTNFLQ
jgi:hypothetical protein